MTIETADCPNGHGPYDVASGCSACGVPIQGRQGPKRATQAQDEGKKKNKTTLPGAPCTCGNLAEDCDGTH